MIEIIKNNGLNIQYLSNWFKQIPCHYNRLNIEEITKTYLFQAIKQNGLALQYSDNAIKNIKLYVLEAVKNNGLALQYASYHLKNNKEIVFEAVKNNSLALQYASKQLQNNRLFLIDCYKNCDKKIKYYNKFIEYFDNIEKNIFDNIFLNENYNILHLVENKINLYNYLLSTKKYEIIYKNEEIHEYIKIKHNILILCFNDLDIDNIYNKDELKLEYQEKFKNINIIFI